MHLPDEMTPRMADIHPSPQLLPSRAETTTAPGAATGRSFAEATAQIGVWASEREARLSPPLQAPKRELSDELERAEETGGA